MKMEEGTGAGDGFFAVLDITSGDAVTAAGIPGEHEHDRAEQALVDARSRRSSRPSPASPPSTRRTSSTRRT